MTFTRLEPGDSFVPVWEVMRPAVEAGEAIALPQEASAADGEAYMRASGGWLYLARLGDEVAGAFFLRANQKGPGAHVANAGFITAVAAQGRGVGRAMGVFALEEARRLGFAAMQFNFVVSSNERAVVLWKSLGFTIVGTLPRVFRRPSGELVDAYVMHRDL